MGYIKSYCRIAPGRVILNGEVYFESDNKPFVTREFLSAVYERQKGDYRKFYKMDVLSKLGFLASELVLEGFDRDMVKEDMGIAVFNRSASLEADREYQKTIQDKEDFFPSPAEFVYTLPNIVTGELSIRNKIHGETAFYITPEFQAESIINVVNNMINFAGMKYVLTGWLEADIFTDTFSCLMVLCCAEPDNVAGSMDEATLKHLNDLY